MGIPKPQADLQAVQQQVGQTTSPKRSTTARIMLGLVRLQHKVPADIPDTDPLLLSMVQIEHGARKLHGIKPSNIDSTLASINDNITRIGTEGTGSAIQLRSLQNNFMQKVGMIKADYNQIAQRQDELQRNIKSSLQNKDEVLGQVSQALAQGKEPDEKLLKKIETDFQALSKKSEKLAIEEEGFSNKLKTLKHEVSVTTEAVSGPVERPPTTTPE